MSNKVNIFIKVYYAMLFHAMSMSCCIMSYNNYHHHISHRTNSHHIPSCHVTSRHVTSYHHITLYHNMISYHDNMCADVGVMLYARKDKRHRRWILYMEDQWWLETTTMMTNRWRWYPINSGEKLLLFFCTFLPWILALNQLWSLLT